MAFGKKKDQASADENGLDILTEVKEPFSFSNFFETHIVEKARQAKRVLAEKGILFFLFSPFQARNRLIAQILILCIGVAFGVVPRASSLVTELQDQAYASETAGLGPKTVGGVTITPAASSNYKRVHVLAFILEGKNLSSNPSKYEVHLARGYGASDWADVTYSWTVYPLEDERRILLVAIDQSKQASGYGAFELYIQLAGDEVADYAKTPFEITLSPAQETTGLYNKSGVHLLALTEAICGTGEIAGKEEVFKEALAEYQIALEQAEAMPVEMAVSPTRDELEALCLSNRVYRALDDDSTTEDILTIEEAAEAPETTCDVVITSNGIKYDSAFIEQLKGSNEYSDEDGIIFDTFDTVSDAKTAVTAAMDSVNDAAMSWYATLSEYKVILNQTVTDIPFLMHATCTNTIEDDIAFTDGKAPGGATPVEPEGAGTSDTQAPSGEVSSMQEPSKGSPAAQEPGTDPLLAGSE